MVQREPGGAPGGGKGGEERGGGLYGEEERSMGVKTHQRVLGEDR